MYTGKRGFTLVELLTVIAIIAILGGILLGALGIVRERAQATQCLNNLRSIGQGAHLYAIEHDGDMPTNEHSGGLRASWMWQLLDYMQPDVPNQLRTRTFKRYFRSPLDADEDRLWSYALNDFLAPGAEPNPKYSPAIHMNEVVRPESTMMASVCTVSYGETDHFHFATMSDRGYVAFAQQVETELLDGKGHYLFVDGHVEPIASTEIARRLATLYPLVAPKPANP